MRMLVRGRSIPIGIPNLIGFVLVTGLGAVLAGIIPAQPTRRIGSPRGLLSGLYSVFAGIFLSRMFGLPAEHVLCRCSRVMAGEFTSFFEEPDTGVSWLHSAWLLAGHLQLVHACGGAPDSRQGSIGPRNRNRLSLRFNDSFKSSTQSFFLSPIQHMLLFGSHTAVERTLNPRWISKE